MKKELKTNVMRILEKEKVPYEAHYYPHGKEAVDGVTVAELTGQNPDYVFKTLVTVSNKKEYFVFVLPVAKELDLKKAAKAVGAKSIEMIHVKDINKITGYIRGGCSPVGMKKQFVTTYHETAQNNPVIMVSGGKIGTQVECKPDDLLKITKGQYADINADCLLFHRLSFLNLIFVSSSDCAVFCVRLYLTCPVLLLQVTKNCVHTASHFFGK